jgi:hypothetical protein
MPTLLWSALSQNYMARVLSAAVLTVPRSKIAIKTHGLPLIQNLVLL